MILQAALFVLFLASTFVAVEPVLTKYRTLASAASILFLSAFVMVV